MPAILQVLSGEAQLTLGNDTFDAAPRICPYAGRPTARDPGQDSDRPPAPAPAIRADFRVTGPDGQSIWVTIMRIRRNVLLLLLALVVLPVAAAYLQWAVFGLPPVPASPEAASEAAVPHGFPAWLRITHYVNFLFIILLIRSGLQILMDHPRLYWNVHCTPGTEWLRLTPIEVPTDRVWTAKDDSRYLSPWIGLPGYRHTVGMARHWHFLSVLFWVGNGAGLRGPAVRHRPVAATGADLLADRARRLGRLRPLRHLPPAAGAERLLPLQRPPAIVLLRRGVHPGTPGDPDRPLDVAGPDEPVQVVSEAARQPADRPVAPLPRHVRLRRLPRRPCDDGGAHRVRPEHEPHRRGHRRHPPDSACTSASWASAWSWR